MKTDMAFTPAHRLLNRRTMLALTAMTAAGSRISMAAAQGSATPAAELLVQVAEQTAELDGKDRIWQINRVVVQDDDEDHEFRVRLGFAYAHEISVELDFDDDHRGDDDDGVGDDITLAVGEGTAIRNRDEIEAEPVGASIGSFYTLELINPEDVNNDENRTAIGAPFPTEAQKYTLTLWQADATAGASISFGDGAVNSLVLALDGSLVFTREDGETSTLASGEAANGSGAGQVEAGDDGASFLVVTLLQGEAPA